MFNIYPQAARVAAPSKRGARDSAVASARDFSQECMASGSSSTEVHHSNRFDNFLHIGDGANVLLWLVRQTEGRALRAVAPADVFEMPRTIAKWTRWVPDPVHERSWC